MEDTSTENTTNIVEVRPEILLWRTIEEAEIAHKKNEAAKECIELWIRVGALARVCFGGTGHYVYALSQVKTADCYLYKLGYREQALHHSSEALCTIDSLPSNDKHSIDVVHIHAICLCILAEIQVHKEMYAKNSKSLVEAEENLVEAERLSGIYSRSPDGKTDVMLDGRIALNLGRLCHKQHKYTLASDCIRKALELFQSLGTEEKDVSLELAVLFELTNVYIEMNDSETALGCLNKAEKTSTKSFGPSSEERAETFLKMASVHINILKQGVSYSDENAAKAEEHLWDAYGIFSVVKGSCNPRALATQDEIVKLFVLLEKHMEAVKVLKDLIPNKCKEYGEGSLEVAKARKVLGSLYLYQGEMSRAFQELKQVREIFIAVHGPNHKDVLEVSKSLDTLSGSEDGTKSMKRQPFKTTS